MILLLDGSFPASAEAYGELDFRLVRWNLTRLTDDDLIKEAANSAFSGVIFLGQAVLSRDEVPEAARSYSLYIAATAESSPLLALRALATNIGSLRRRVRAGGIDVIYAREVQERR